MASVTSLGLHQPTALQYAIQEQLIPEDAPRSEYSWEIDVDHDGEEAGEDELFVTKDSVIWSRGNIFRKCFGFKLEKEPVTQALLTHFPRSEQSLPDTTPRHGPNYMYATDGRILSKALVVFLKTQAHVYFLDGTSHVVHMPFEVESACAAPQGVIIQRKQRNDSRLAASIRFPRVAPNSFISPQSSPLSTRTSLQTTFTTETLGRPRTLPLRLNASFDNTWDMPTEENDSQWPRLMCLTDPLLELGLVVTNSEKSSKGRIRRSSEKSPHFLDRAEEIAHIEILPIPDGLSGNKVNNKIVLAVTVNRETSMYTVWKLEYIRNDDPFRAPRHSAKKRESRRRSSMQPGLISGVTSPVANDFKESFSAALPAKRHRKSGKVEKVDKTLENLESTLGLDKEPGVGRRASRRVSSMLARADLSASQDRTAFGDQAQVANHPTSRRDTSHGSTRTRTSGAFVGGSHGGPIPQHSTVLGSFLEAPVDNLLEELNAGGDFEGFHTMGLDDHDFDGLTQEISVTKVHSVPVENSNVRYSLSRQPARDQCRVFCLLNPQHTEDERNHRQVVVGIQDPLERRLQLLILNLRLPPGRSAPTPENASITFGQLRKAQNVIDSCKIVDGEIAMILVLSESSDGKRELSLQAPWSQLALVHLPPKFALANLRSLDYGGSLIPREVGVRRSITPIIADVAGLRHPKLSGVVDLLDSQSQSLHQIRIQLQPTCPQVAKILKLLHSVLLPYGQSLLSSWWQIVNWLNQEHSDLAHVEWSALTIQILILYLSLGTQEGAVPVTSPTPHRRTRSLLRSSSGAQVDLGDWDLMNVFEKPNSASHPPWIESKAWQWAVEEEDGAATMFQPSQGRQEDLSFMASHLKYAQTLLALETSSSEAGGHSYLSAPLLQLAALEGNSRMQQAQDIFVALHLFLEEGKLDVTTSQGTSPGSIDLRAILNQIARWLKWNQWSNIYELEMPVDITSTWTASSDLVISVVPSEPQFWSVLEWIQSNLTEDLARSSVPSMLSRLSLDDLPRTWMFQRLFTAIQVKNVSAITFVQAMHDSGITSVILESLPEAILVPLQDAITQCQAHPPLRWSNDLLELVDRSDVSSVLLPETSSRPQPSNLLPPSHLASWEFSSLCQNVMDFNDVSTDDVAESDKQAVIRAIFKEDRRLEETKLMLTTTKPRVVRLEAQPEWSEPFYLEQQKEVVTRLATNTLSIPTGRSLMNYCLRFPLLTQKFHINGFVLNCTVKPSNVIVGVDKSLFTEEKIAWAFFHSGVAAGLSISRQAKGIDTSWILYNKPGNDLNNRHAGFLLALGLNGHLKGLAKWVAFKYLTPKHTMTSIGLLLGLAASYMGTMDSLITRLLSVHVTRMLPRGAAELNLSPLTQTTGIMGIGLLYCNSQHRRMSEIMMSEIEHVETEDDEEPLRSECYRLAAGFALGFINLGKGKDLKGLHDMRVTEKLLTLATATKKVELVHILDRACAAAVVAIALIYMKSEDHIVARKIDVPEAMLQFDYIRPDILLLRTMAKHLILWSEIEPTHDWIRENLPARYHSRVDPPTQPFDHPSHGPLNSNHLPFLTILAGLCFAIALRYAGSGDLRVRDLLLNYLHRFYGRCRAVSPKANFDDRTVQVTARMCLDVVALSTATVMAGTCDLKVLRILRSLHGRNDLETTYGSHMATHMAIGVLSLGCGTQTFSTSDLAIASLLVAFYPVFPDQVQDNKSHLQAFRHFWVLATDPRCLITKDVSTNAPVSVPISIKFKDKNHDNEEKEEVRATPSLLPPLDEIASVKTNSPEFWNVNLDFAGAGGEELREKFVKNQVLYLRRRPAAGSPFAATMLAQGREVSASEEAHQPLEWLFEEAPSLGRLTQAERGIVLDTGIGGPDVGLSKGSAVDARLMLEQGVRDGGRDELVGLKGLFEWVEWRARRTGTEKESKEKSRGKGKEKRRVAIEGDVKGEELKGGWEGEGWLRESVVEGLKGMIWLAGKERGE